MVLPHLTHDLKWKQRSGTHSIWANTRTVTAVSAAGKQSQTFGVVRSWTLVEVIWQRSVICGLRDNTESKLRFHEHIANEYPTSWYWTGTQAEVGGRRVLYVRMINWPYVNYHTVLVGWLCSRCFTCLTIFFPINPAQDCTIKMLWVIFFVILFNIYMHLLLIPERHLSPSKNCWGAGGLGGAFRYKRRARKPRRAGCYPCTALILSPPCQRCHN